MVFFHGLLKVHVISAEDLPDTDTAFFNIDRGDVTDPYVTGSFGEARIFKTRYISNDLNPVWDERFRVQVCHEASELKIDVKDKEHIGAAWLASMTIPSEDLESGDLIKGSFDLMNGEDVKGKINMSVQYIPKEALEDEMEKEVKNSYFPLRENNRMILYQDAETPPLPQFESVTNPDGSPYEPTRCWRDLYEAIRDAQKFIYITGWSVYTGINLLRGPDAEDGLSNVGELLKLKAEEGVKVLVMVWNEILSGDAYEGLMGTYDEDTRRFFDGTNVECHLVPRQKTDGILADKFVGTCYTHHQKTVILDAEDPDTGLRRVVSFIGGIDITSGRYDTPEFPLFKTLNNLHLGDFYENCVPGATQDTGPREPWHDCHGRVDGPAALDIKKNFEERWCKQADHDVARLCSLSRDEFVLDSPGSIPDSEGGSWSLQLFRSITSDSCVFDFDRREALHSKGGRLVQNDIARCMVHQIRIAKNFIYMENQYFLGSAYAWLEDSSTLTHHIVPLEIATKIVEKIKADEKFKVYIVIPMFPEGDPHSAASQEILRWQYRTMQAMYRRIADAIADVGSDCHPTDYLAFFCLAKRESPDEVPTDDLVEPDEGTPAYTVRLSLRHPVYVHSKMTIIDDDYVLMGSANVNQRSLGGNRDSEIAIGGYQPDHLAEAGDPRGQVHTYRMALWAAHLGGYHEEVLNPASDECMEKVREVSRGFWDLYTADNPEHSDVHILPYPVNVDQSGEVSPLDSPWDCFPDTSAPVIGTKSDYLPGKLTT